MKQPKLTPGTWFELREYDDIVKIVLKEWKQTYAEAAKELGISLSTFQKLIRQQWRPDLNSVRGKLFADRFYEWTDHVITAEQAFPQAIYTEEFKKRPKTHIKSVSHRLLARRSTDEITLALPSPEPPKPKKPTSTKKRRKKQKAGKNG